MYYSNGNYQAFARPRKPKGVDEKSAYLVGAGLGSLAAAAFLIRDGQMAGNRITILEAGKVAGGACDGIVERKGFVVRGDREFEDHMECLWDLFRSIPSAEVEGASVLDEFFWLQKDDPTYSLCRTTQNRGEPNPTDGKLTLSPKAQREIVKVCITRDEDLYDKKITDIFSEDFFKSNFWLYWRTMFAFEDWHSALEMKLYLNRFIHVIGGMADLTAITQSRYNQYESFILPLVNWLKERGVTIQYDTRVTNVLFDIKPERKAARRIEWIRDGKHGGVDVTENDLVFVTNGSCVENASVGDHHTPAVFDPEIREGGVWALWRNIAKQDPSFGRPDKFCTYPDQSYWMSATLTTLDDRIPPYIQKITQRDPLTRDGRCVSGGNMTIRDSAWSLSWNCERQPHFKAQTPNQAVLWFVALWPWNPGNFVKKPMNDCTGEEIAQEWLYHLGAPVEQIPEIAAKSVNCNPCMMPFITSFFMPRHAGDRPDVVPEHAVNFAFLGQFAETKRDTIFTVEYSMRTAMEAVYTLLDVERGVPEVWGSQYDIRVLLNAVTSLRDGERFEIPAPILKMLEGVDIGELLRQYGVIGELDEDHVTISTRKSAPRELTPVL